MITTTSYKQPDRQAIIQVMDSLPETAFQNSVFTSRHWISSWLASLPKMPELLVFQADGEAIGMALIGSVRLPFNQCAVKKTLLNQSGNMSLDQVWIEYNTIVTSDWFKQPCAEALLSYLFNQTDSHQCFVSLTNEIDIWHSVSLNSRLKIESKEVLGYEYELSEELNDPQRIIERLSKNTRSQARRSLKKVVREYGELVFEVAPTGSQAHFFNELACYHRQRWGNSPQGSGFDNEFFIRHHQDLLSQQSVGELTRVYAGETAIAYAYHLLWGDRVYFYCFGLNDAIASSHIKPGFIYHILAMAHYAKRGMRYYDYLGGDSQYKQSLSTASYPLYQLTVYRNHWRNRLFHILKAVKNKMCR